LLKDVRSMQRFGLPLMALLNRRSDGKSQRRT